MAAHTVAEVQTRLMKLGYDVGPDGADGRAGTNTDKAVAKFQTDMIAKGLHLQATGTLDPETLDALFPMSPITDKPKSIAPTLQDWFLNLVLSKTNWAAAAMVGVLVAFLQTKFGWNIDAQTQTSLTVLIAGAFAALIGVLQTRFNSPHVATKQPAVVMQPSETK